MSTHPSLDALTALLDEDRLLVWTPEEAIALARLFEDIAPDYGAHVALTGGCLYKDGKRKDADILFYRIRQQPSIDEEGLLAALVERGGVVLGQRFGWVLKASYQGKPVDLFFPEQGANAADELYDSESVEYRCVISCIKDLNKLLIDAADPTQPLCPACKMPMVRTQGLVGWVHAPITQPTSKPVCDRGPVEDDERVVGGKCPRCGEKLQYSVLKDQWLHEPAQTANALTANVTVSPDMDDLKRQLGMHNDPQKWEATVAYVQRVLNKQMDDDLMMGAITPSQRPTTLHAEKDCSECGKHFYYIQDIYKGGDMCPDCASIGRLSVRGSTPPWHQEDEI